MGAAPLRLNILTSTCDLLAYHVPQTVLTDSELFTLGVIVFVELQCLLVIY